MSKEFELSRNLLMVSKAKHYLVANSTSNKNWGYETWPSYCFIGLPNKFNLVIPWLFLLKNNEHLAKDSSRRIASTKFIKFFFHFFYYFTTIWGTHWAHKKCFHNLFSRQEGDFNFVFISRFNRPPARP